LSNINYSLDFELSDNNYIPNLFGVDDKNIHILEKVNNVQIKYRGNKIKIIGTKSSIKNTKEEILLLFEEAKKGIDIDEDKIMETRSMKILEINPQDQMDLFFQTKKRKISPRTQNQKDYFQLLNSKDIVFAYGPAGTGKTFLAVAKAVASLQQGLVKKIILSRPAVEAGEALGFLPGDLKEKLDPYLQPLYDALRDMIPSEKLNEYIEGGIIQIAPLAFMRGRTLDKAFVILDEAQNTTTQQMKMFLTRMGMSAKFVITGDETQIDLPPKQPSGLLQCLIALRGVNGISIVKLDEKDVIRHELVKKIIKAYKDKIENK